MRNDDDLMNYECVDPDVGEQLWLLGMPDIDPELKRELEDHVAVCADCRLQLALQRQLEAMPVHGLAAKAEAAGGSRPVLRRRWTLRGLEAAAILSLAACLVLTFFLPPRDPDEPRTLRSRGDDLRFLRPVAEEVVLGSHVDFAWTPVADASGYVLQVRDENGNLAWETETQGTEAAVPDDVELPADTRLQAYLEIIPPYLTPDTGVAVSFHTGSATEFAAYRAGVNPTWVWLIGAAGLILLGWVIVLKIGERRPARIV